MIGYACDLFRFYVLGGIGYSADHGLLRLTPLPHGTSAMCNKKAVLCTVSFVISLHCFVQARQCSEKTKTTLSSGFLVAHCSRDSGGIRTHDPQLRRLLLYPAELRNHPLAKHNKLCETAFVTFCGAKVNKIYRTTKFLSPIFQILPVTGVVQPKKGELASSPF